MASLKRETEQILLFLDNLYCQEDHFQDELELDYSCCSDESVKRTELFTLVEQDDVCCQYDVLELETLLLKEQLSGCNNIVSSDERFRREGVDWMRRVSAYYGFTSLTSVLSVNYFDRFIASIDFQKDKPWMSQLAAVACLSLAAKVEEMQAPLLSYLQVEECKYVFEPKTVQRMELLVLSTLNWKMHPVTPISYFDYVMRRFELKRNTHWEFLWRCERLILTVIEDSRSASFLPSVLATATILHVIQEFEPYNSTRYQNQLMSTLKINKDEVDPCYEFITGLSGNYDQMQNGTNKRKYQSIPRSPCGVIDVSFSRDSSSNESWVVVSPVSSQLEPIFKRSRSQGQQMPLPSVSRVFMNVLSSPK